MNLEFGGNLNHWPLHHEPTILHGPKILTTIYLCPNKLLYFLNPTTFLPNHLGHIAKLECIPVGCVPPAHWPYLVVSARGVCHTHTLAMHAPTPDHAPPAMHAPLPCMPPRHVHPLPCTPLWHACPHHACPLPCTPPCQAHPLPCTPPPCMPPTMHASLPDTPPPCMPPCHACSPCQDMPPTVMHASLPHMPSPTTHVPLPCMPPPRHAEITYDHGVDICTKGSLLFVLNTVGWSL